MHLLFRLSGNFVWPPHVVEPGTDAVVADAAATRAGSVEIHFHPRTPGAQPSAVLRWLPASVALPVPLTDADIATIPGGTAAWGDPATAFDTLTGGGASAAAVWVADVFAGATKGERLGFHGGRLFEQFEVAADGVDGPRLLLLPTIASVREDGKLYCSSLLIGQPASRSFRFNLQIVTPLPGASAGPGVLNRFPSSLVHDSEAATEKLLHLAALTVGSARSAADGPGRSEQVPWPAGVSRRFGDFALAWRGGPTVAGARPRISLAGTRKDENNKPITSSAILTRLWPVAQTPGSEPSFFASILACAGLDTAAGELAKWKLALGDEAELDDRILDIEFLRPPSESHGDGASVLRLRVGMKQRTPLAGGAGLPIRLDGVGVAELLVQPDTSPPSSSYVVAELDLLVDTSESSLRTLRFGPPPGKVVEVATRVVIRWREKAKFAAPPVGPVSATRLVRCGIPAALETLRRVRAGLGVAAAEQPIGLAFDVDGNPPEQVASFTFRPVVCRLRLGRDGVSLATGSKTRSGSPLPVTLDLSSAPLTLTCRPGGEPSILVPRAPPVAVTVTLARLDDARIPSGCVTAFALDLNIAPPSYEALIGGLLFKQPKRPRDGGLLMIGGAERDTGAYPMPGPAGSAVPVAVAIRDVRLAFDQIRPIGVDGFDGDRGGGGRGLLINPQGEDGADYVLELDQSLGPVEDLLLEARIRDTSATRVNSRGRVVLSEAPFSILRFTQTPLAGLGGEGGNEVANYSSADRTWRFKKASDTYHYTFPPQAIGESADKPGRLEIHDLPPVEEKQDVVAPYMVEPPGGLRRRTVDFRLTPATDVWIRPSDVERGYFLPEWDAAALFRQAGELGLGVALTALRAEFLYGLTVGVDTSRETGPARRARVAEVDALFGSLPGIVTSDLPFAVRWNELTTAARRRPERLEVWADDPDSVVDFAPARFSAGVSFGLRETALHRAPVDGRTDATREANLTRIVPLGAGGADARRGGGPRHHPQGLSGGALWPVESRNLFEALLADPRSSGGAIEGIALSPIGGDAAQKAEFLNGGVTILSETRNGFVERQKVEVIGRIAPFWHRAKHVVVYERTVNPSAQFAPRQDDGEFRSRRPILRKVREYVELLQPERSYPDFGEAHPRSAGFLDRVRFNSHVIAVDSAWGRDIGEDAWEVPLWNRHGARQRPQVYPMPDIAFCSLGEGRGERPLVTQACLDPDLLYFFAEFGGTRGHGRVDTDAWKPRIGIDYVDVASAETLARSADGASSAKQEEVDDRSERRRPPVSRFLPGTRRFTWRLAPAARKTAINAGRGDKPVYVGLESVSFMRMKPDATARPRDELTGAQRLTDALVACDTPPAWTSEPGEPFDLDRDRFPILANYHDVVSELKTLEQASPDDLRAFLNGFARKVDEARVSAREWTKTPLETLNKNLKVIEALVPGSDVKPCDRLRNEAASAINAKSMLVGARLRDWEAEVLASLADIASKSKDSLRTELIRRAMGVLAPIFDTASADVGRFSAGIETARAVVEATRADVVASGARARGRVQQHLAAWDRGKPWSDERRRAFLAGYAASVASLDADFDAAIGEARHRLAVELTGLAGPLGKEIAAALDLVRRGHDGLIGTGEGAEALLKQAGAAIVGPLRGLLAEIATRLDDASKRLAAADGKIPVGHPDEQTVRDGIAARRADLAALVGRCAEIDTALTAFQERFTIDADVVGPLVVAVTTPLTASITDAATLVADARDFLGELTDAALGEVADEVGGLVAHIEAAGTRLGTVSKDLSALGHPIDAFAARMGERLDGVVAQVGSAVDRVASRIDGLAAELQKGVAKLEELAPASALRVKVSETIGLVLDRALSAYPVAGDSSPEGLERLAAAVSRTVGEVADELRNVTAQAIGVADDLSKACEIFDNSLATAKNKLMGMAGQGAAYFDGKIADVSNALDGAIAGLRSALDQAQGIAEALARLKTAGEKFDAGFREINASIAHGIEDAKAYGHRLHDAFAQIDKGGLAAAPSNILRAYAAVTSAPEIAALKADIDRIRATFDELSDVVRTTPARALFDRLGDELKAIGLSLPFDGIGERIVPADLSALDFGKVFRNFGGLDLGRLFQGLKVPPGVSDAVKVTHDFDAEQARAWVQIDVAIPLPERRTLFEFAAFKADFLDTSFTGRVRLEASKDTERVEATGFGRIVTDLDMQVTGTSLVQFRRLGLNFARESGLKVDFDPKNVKLNEAMRFVQDYLADLFPGEIGGMKTIKRDGIPIGLEYEFAMPPMTLAFGTSGVSNISIANRFALVAHPDFVLRDTFNLSRPERPFIFSIFILGGTGYVQIDTEYRPFEGKTAIAVEFAAGASAALSFSAGPFSGQVFVTLSVSITYRKLIGEGTGSGLSIAAVLVIAGYVNVCGIIDCGIYVMLRLTYRDDGQVDADGSLSVSIKISVFFTVRARADVHYKLRGGRSETRVSTSANVEADPKIVAAAKKLQAARG